ncbi:hypothetical protein ACS0TY_022662 [Phlomoides rotata]
MVSLTAARRTIDYVALEPVNRGFGEVSYKADENDTEDDNSGILMHTDELDFNELSGGNAGRPSGTSPNS